jgi:hypothetical protein
VSEQELAIVYAVKVAESERGKGLYAPRSQAQPSPTMPKLWVSLADAQRQAKRWANPTPYCEPPGASWIDKPEVVAFRLVPVDVVDGRVEEAP